MANFIEIRRSLLLPDLGFFIFKSNFPKSDLEFEKHILENSLRISLYPSPLIGCGLVEISGKVESVFCLKTTLYLLNGC